MRRTGMIWVGIEEYPLLRWIGETVLPIGFFADGLAAASLCVSR